MTTPAPPPEYFGRRLVLRDSTGAEDVADLADRAGWPVLESVDTDPELGLNRETVWAIEPRSTFHYVEDAMTRVRYVTVASDSVEQAERHVATIARRVDSFLVRWLVDGVLAGGTKDQRILAIFRLGTGAPKRATDGALEAMWHAARDPHPTVRRAAARATLYAEWPECEPILIQLSVDADPKVAKDALNALNGLAFAGIIDR